MGFDALDVAVKMVESLKPHLKRLVQRDKDLARQVKKASSSVVLNLSEGRRRVGGDRIHLFLIAAGSAEEVRGALKVAVAFDYLDADSLEESLTFLDRDLAMLHRLTSGGRAPRRDGGAGSRPA